MSIGFAFVSQRVVFGSDDQRRRQPRKIVGPDRRDIRRQRIGIAHIVTIEPFHDLSSEKRPVLVFLHRRPASRLHIAHRIDKSLKLQCRPAPVSHHLRHHSCQVPPRAISRHSQPRRIYPKFRCMLSHPNGSRITVLSPRRKRILRRKPIIHRHENSLRLHHHIAHLPVMRVNIPQHPPTPMKKHHPRRRTTSIRPLRPINPNRYLIPIRPSNSPILHPPHRRRLPHNRPRLHPLSHLLRTNIRRQLKISLSHSIQYHLSLRINRHSNVLLYIFCLSWHLPLLPPV